MGCSHYLNLIYGVFVKKAFLLERYHAEFEKYKQESGDDDEYCFMLNFEKSFKDVKMTFHQTDDHDFGDDTLIGFSINSNKDDKEMVNQIEAEIIIMPTLVDFNQYNDFFSEFSKTPKIIAFMGGCSCCS